jgi:hypothetical protein
MGVSFQLPLTWLSQRTCAGRCATRAGSPTRGHSHGGVAILIACFSSTLFHRSGANTTDRVRRVYVAQYSAEPILSKDGSQPLRLAEPLLVDGKRVS